MNAGTEGNVTGGPAVDVESLGFMPAPRMAAFADCFIEA
jgi:hypothetical protein